MILVFHLLCWAEKCQTPYPKLFALAGILAVGLIWALWIVWAYVARGRTYSKH